MIWLFTKFIIDLGDSSKRQEKQFDFQTVCNKKTSYLQLSHDKFDWRNKKSCRIQIRDILSDHFPNFSESTEMLTLKKESIKWKGMH
jgi:hypothetical protein